MAKRFDNKDKVDFKFYDVTAWSTTICNKIHILSNILGRKGNQTMKFGQLTEDNIRNIFLETSYTKCSGETNPRPFFEKLKNENISESIVQSFIQFVSIACQV